MAFTQLYYPPTTNGLQKTLDAQLDEGATSSMTLNNVTGVQDKPGVVVINRIDTNSQEKSSALREYVVYTGVSGSTLTGLTRAIGGTTDQDHAVGSVVEFIFDLTSMQAMIDFLLVEHNEADGTHKETALDSIISGTEAQGDVIYHNGTVWSRLAAGTSGQFLQTLGSSSNPAWVDAVPGDGWIAAGETWTYASADDPTFTFTISGNKTTKYAVGMKIKLTQTTAKYFIITKVAYGAPNTTITVFGGTDYDLADAAITNPFYSTSKAPFGFPVQRNKWTVEVANASSLTQASPVNGTWYNLGSLSISVPIGEWDVYYEVAGNCAVGSGTASVYTTLSTANNSESDAEMSAFVAGITGTVYQTMRRTQQITLTSKTSYYLNAKTADNSITAIYFRGDLVTTVMRAVCDYI